MTDPTYRQNEQNNDYLAYTDSYKSPEPPVNINNPNHENNPNQSQLNKKKIIFILATLLFSAAFFIVGFYAESFWSASPATQNTESEAKIDVGEVMLKHFGSENSPVAGTVKFKFWFDLDNNGREDAWERGQAGMAVSVRRKGEQLPFITQETDGEGTVILSGLEGDDFEVSYFHVYPSNYQPSPSQHFWLSQWFEIIESSQNLSGVLNGDFVDLKFNQSGGSLFSMGLKKYQPTQLVALQNNSSLNLYDVSIGRQFAAASFYKESTTLPRKFEVRDNKVFYVERGILYRYDPLRESSYSEKVYEQVTAPEDSYFAISPMGTALVYGNSDGTFFHNDPSACGRQAVRYQDKLVQIQHSSYPYNPISAHFSDENRAVIYGRTHDDVFRLYLLTCRSKTLEVKQLPLTTDWDFHGGLVAHNRLLIRGPLIHQGECAAELCQTSVNYPANFYLYDLNKKEIKALSSTEDFGQSVIANLSQDGRYAILINHANGSTQLFDFSEANKANVSEFDLGKYLVDRKNYSLRDTSFAYLGDSKYLFIDAYGNCGQQKNCASVWQFNLKGGVAENVKKILDLQDFWPERLVGGMQKWKNIIYAGNWFWWQFLQLLDCLFWVGRCLVKWVQLVR